MQGAGLHACTRRNWSTLDQLPAFCGRYSDQLAPLAALKSPMAVLRLGLGTRSWEPPSSPRPPSARPRRPRLPGPPLRPRVRPRRRSGRLYVRRHRRPGLRSCQLMHHGDLLVGRQSGDRQHVPLDPKVDPRDFGLARVGDAHESFVALDTPARHAENELGLGQPAVMVLPAAPRVGKLPTLFTEQSGSNPAGGAPRRSAAGDHPFRPTATLCIGDGDRRPQQFSPSMRIVTSAASLPGLASGRGAICFSYRNTRHR